MGGKNSAQLKLLEELEFSPMKFDELYQVQSAYMFEYTRFMNQALSQHRAMHWSFSDYMCYRFVLNDDNIMNSAIQMHKHLAALSQGSYQSHPFFELNSKLLGINGYAQPDIATLIFIFGVKETLERDLGPAQNGAISLSVSLDFLKKHFKDVRTPNFFKLYNHLLPYRTNNSSTKSWRRCHTT